MWVDNLRVLVVAGVIVVHTATAYLTGIADWYYDERTTSELWSTLLAFPVVVGALFGLGPLFLLAGWFSPKSLDRRGPGRHRDGDVIVLPQDVGARGDPTDAKSERGTASGAASHYGPYSRTS